jgi:PST family polysaccharide transporter
MGGASAVTLAASFIRAKIIAITLGAAGIGLFGILSSFNANLSAIAGLGLGISGVRSISSASQEDKPMKIAAVRRVGSMLAWGALILVLMASYPCSMLIFGDATRTLELLVAGLAVPLIIATSVFSAMIQSRGDVAALARVQVTGAACGLIPSLPLIWFAGSIGISAAILIASALPAFLTWRMATKHGPSVQVQASKQDIKHLIVLGFALMGSALFSQLSVLLVRTIIIRYSGLDAAGHFHAANAIAMSLPGLVLVSMGTDFFPRVAAAESETDARIQTEIQIKTALLFSLPLLCCLLTLGRLGIRILYANEGFDAACPLLAWMVWGVFFRIIAWPMGYWLMARGSSGAMIAVDFISNLLATILPLILLPYYGLAGAAAAFFIGCLSHALILFFVVRLRSGSWLSSNILGWGALSATLLVMAQLSVAPFEGEYWGAIPTALIAVFCVIVYYRLAKDKN